MAKLQIMTEEEIVRAFETEPKSVFICTPMTRYRGQDAMFAQCSKCGCEIFFIDKFMADVKRKICTDCAIKVLGKMNQAQRDKMKLSVTQNQMDLYKIGPTR